MMEAYSSLGKDRVSALLSNIVHAKMSLAVGFASRASIYDAVLTAYELSTAQCIVLALLYGLVNADVSICTLLATLSSNVQHLRSSYLKVWLKEDFRFDQKEIYRAFSTAAYYTNAGLINVPSHVLQILISVVNLYNVVDLCKEEGDKDTLSWLESLGVDVGSKSSPEDDSPAIVEVFIEENAENSQLAEEEAAGNSQLAEEEIEEEENASASEEEDVLASEEENASALEEDDVSAQEEEDASDQEEDASDQEEDASDQEEEDVLASEEENASALEEDASAQEEEDTSAQEEDASAPEAGASGTVPAAQSPSIPFIEVRFAEFETDEEVYDYEYGSSDYDEYLSEEDSDYSDPNVESEEESEDPARVNLLSTLVNLTHACVNSGMLGSNEAQYKDVNGKTLLHQAAEHGSVRCVKKLIRMGVDVDAVDKWRRTAAHVAATEGKLQALRALYHHGNTNLGILDNRGDSMLHTAADRGHTQVVRWLLMHGLCLEESGRGGWRPLHRASQQGHLETVRLLVDSGACPNMMANVGGTALHRAAYWNKLEVARFLLSRRAIVDVVDNRGDTPLNMAAKQGHPEMVQLLLDYGADASLTDRFEMTPYDWAQRNQHTEVINLMVSRGADI